MVCAKRNTICYAVPVSLFKYYLTWKIKIKIIEVPFDTIPVNRSCCSSWQLYIKKVYLSFVCLFMVLHVKASGLGKLIYLTMKFKGPIAFLSRIELTTYTLYGFLNCNLKWIGVRTGILLTNLIDVQLKIAEKCGFSSRIFHFFSYKGSQQNIFQWLFNTKNV